MNRQKGILLLVALVLIGGAGVLLRDFRQRQPLRPPGVTTHPLPGSIRLVVDLPERVLDYHSDWVEIDELSRSVLPQDTSFGQRTYQAPDGFAAGLSVVLMGSDRTSLHKPQFCLAGEGYEINQATSSETSIHIDQPCGYDLPVVKLFTRKEVEKGGQKQVRSCVFVYWYVADDRVSASVSGIGRMWSTITVLARTGMLQRWAFVRCFADCPPGAEDATFERMKQFIVAAVPQFQLTPRPGHAEISAR
jgi:hypothetical protein